MTKLLSATTLLLAFCLTAQDPEKAFMVKFTQDSFVIDGELDEAAWEQAESAGEFQQYFPFDNVPAKYQTDIRMLTDGKTLYIGMKVYTPGDDYVIPSLERDFRAGGNDNITLMFDTFNDGTNAFLFGINPYGVRREALISGGGQDLRGFTTSWDVKWRGESKIHEATIPPKWRFPLPPSSSPKGRPNGVSKVIALICNPTNAVTGTWYPKTKV